MAELVKVSFALWNLLNQNYKVLKHQIVIQQIWLHLTSLKLKELIFRDMDHLPEQHKQQQSWEQKHIFSEEDSW